MKIKRCILWFLLIGLCIVIFCFSGQTGEQSHSVSARWTQPIMNLLRPFLPPMAPQEALSFSLTLQLVVRKGAHFCEYALLASIAFLLADSYALSRSRLYAFCFAALYAASDELHQLFSAGRDGKLQDVALDSLGALFGIMLLHCLLRRLRSKKA